MLDMLNRWITNIRVAHARRRAAETLAGLTDAQLLDVGLERGAIADYVATGLPWAEVVTDEGRSFAPSLQGCG